MRSGNDNSEGGGDGHKDVKGIARGKAENTKGNEKIGAKTNQGSRRKKKKEAKKSDCLWREMSKEREEKCKRSKC